MEKTNIASPVNTKVEIKAIKPRDELSFIFLQFQRTLVLAALSFYNWWDRKKPRAHGLVIGPHILDIEDPHMVHQYLQFMRATKNRWLIRLTSFLHEKLDRSRRMKDFFIGILLYLRMFAQVLRPRKIYGPFYEWVEKVDLPDEIQTLGAIRDQKFQEVAQSISLFVTKDALGSMSELADNVAQCRSYGLTSHLWVYQSQLAIEQIESQLQAHHQEQTGLEIHHDADFSSALEKSLQSNSNWILFQTEPGKLATRAVYEYVQKIKSKPELTMAFGDFDFIEDRGSRFHPHFHPAWNLRYFIGEDCLRGLVLVRKTKLVEVLQSHRPESLQELLILLAVEFGEDPIEHIPKIIFHSQAHQDVNTAKRVELLNKYMSHKFEAQVVMSARQIPKIIWPLPNPLPKVSILIPTKDKINLLSKLVSGILNQTDYENLEIIIVDNQSVEPKTHEYFKAIAKNPKVMVVRYPYPFNYSAINNFGFQYCTGEVLALLNNDMEVIHPSWLKELVKEVSAPQVGAVGAKLYFKNNFIQHAGVVLGSGLSPNHLHGLEHRSARGYCNRLLFAHQLSAVTGACLIMPSHLFKSLGGFNAQDLAVAYNDIDLCLRVIKAGYKVVWTPQAELYHLESASRPPDRRSEQIVRYRHEVDFMRKNWKQVIFNDPYYNPNFKRGTGNFKVSADH